MAAQYDARTVGMGGTGSAFVNNAHSLFLNPAGLQGIDKVGVSATLTILDTAIKAPFTPNQSVSAAIPPTPLGYLGAGFRVHERVVVGAAVYTFMGGGGAFEKVPALGGQDFKNVAGVFEFQPGVSFKVLDNLSIGAGYRISYMVQQVKAPGLGPTSPGLEADLSGMSFLGANVGIQYKPAKPVALAFVYRSKTYAEMTGDATLALPAPTPPMKAEMRTEFATPHEFKLGSAFTLLDEKLVLAADAKVILYADSNKDAPMTITTPAGANRTVTPLGWNNVVAGGVGAEYTIADMVPVRAGFSASSSATPYRTASPFALSPKPFFSGHFGVGLKLKSWDFGLGCYIGGSSMDLKNPNFPALNTSPIPGEYSNFTVVGALSANGKF